MIDIKGDWEVSVLFYDVQWDDYLNSTQRRLLSLTFWGRLRWLFTGRLYPRYRPATVPRVA